MVTNSNVDDLARMDSQCPSLIYVYVYVCICIYIYICMYIYRNEGGRDGGTVN